MNLSFHLSNQMFELYNGVLRAWANPTSPGLVPNYAAIGAGLDVCARFTSTLHAINSGVVKLSQLQPAGVVYRGISGMKLPEPFLVPSKHNIRGGIEYAFMSTTLDQKVALRYATSGTGEPSTLMVMQMGMVDRGAQLDWLSQYPEEKEILLPPLTGIEVTADEVTADNVRVLQMRLNINLRSTTLEQLLAARKKELEELAHVVRKDLQERKSEGDIPRRLVAVDRLELEIAEQEHSAFNENGRFVEATEAMLGQLPRRGDQVELLRVHSAPVFALAAPVAPIPGTALLVSGSWDGTTAQFGRGDAGAMRHETTHHTSPVLAVAALEPTGLMAVGLFDNSVDLVGVGGRKLVGAETSGGGVAALAWLPERQWLASGSIDTNITLYQLANQDMQAQLSGHDGAIRGLCWVDGGRWLASGSLDGTARLWDPVSGQIVEVLAGHTGPVTAVVTGDTDGEPWLATASADRSIIIWGLETMRPIVKTPWCHSLGVCALAWLPKQRWIASSSADTTIKLWQLPDDEASAMVDGTMRAVQTLRGHTDAVHALAVIPARGWLASGSSDGSVRLWRMDVGGGLEGARSSRRAHQHCDPAEEGAPPDVDGA
jgi:WD40 repeat protein